MVTSRFDNRTQNIFQGIPVGAHILDFFYNLDVYPFNNCYEPLLSFGFSIVISRPYLRNKLCPGYDIFFFEVGFLHVLYLACG